MSTTSITIRIDAELKKQAEELFQELGMNMTTAITIFTKAAVREQRIPFELAIDPFFSEANLAHLRDSIRSLEEGQGLVHKSIAQLREMEDA